MSPKKPSNLSVLLYGLGGGLIAALVNFSIFRITSHAGVQFNLPAPREGMEPIVLSDAPIILFSAVPALVSVLLLLLLNRVARHPFRIFFIVAMVVLLVSFLPLSIDATTDTRLVLGAMHIVAAAAIVSMLWSAYR